MTKTRSYVYVYRLCATALLIAMMFLLKRTIAIETPFFKLNFASLPIMLGGMLFGPVEGMLVGLLGELIAQIIGPYGLAPTTVLYVIPAGLRGLVVGLGALWCRQATGKRLENRPALCYIVGIAGAVTNTVANTVSIWIESVMYHTEFAVHIPFLPARFATGIVTAVCVTTVCIPLAHALRRSGALKYAE